MLLTITLLFASTPKIVTYRSQKDFEKGKPRGVSITSKGEVLLSPSNSQVLNPELPFIWSGMGDSQGNLFVAGGGNTGQIYKVDSNNGTTTFFDAERFQIYALAVDKQNNLYAATSPQGKVYKISASSAKVADAGFFDPDEVYIWDLAFDSKNNLYVATGEKGNIYKVDPSGRGALFYESEDTHIRKLRFDKGGSLIVGTSNKGIVLRIDAQGQAFVLYDSPMAEVTEILADAAGNIYAAGAGEERQRPPVPAIQPTTDAEVNEPGEVVEGEEDEPDAGVPIMGVAPPAPSKSGSELYRIDADGVVKTFWRSRNERIFAMTLNGAGDIVIGTGDPGRLYSVNPSGEHILLLELDDLQITTMGKDSQGQIFVGTSNAGKVYRLSHDFNSKGEYLSDIIDATVVSQWGAISWQADAKEGTAVVLHSRSGNTERPDKTWSPWSQKYSAASGTAIVSAPARFMQFKAELSTSAAKNSPVLREVSFSYLQKNLPPEITDITILPPGEYYPDAASNGASDSQLETGANSGQNSQSQYTGRKSFQKGYRSVSWKSRDENGDNLSYDLYYGSPNQQNWKPLAKEIRGSVFSWDSELMPDGDYLVKIVARDGLSNPPALALTSDKISQPFKVDNSGPKISVVNVVKGDKNSKATFAVEDGLSLVSTIEYALDVDSWKLLYPVDGICDSRIEKFEITFENQKGSHSLVIKAKDELGNIGFAKTNVEL